MNNKLLAFIVLYFSGVQSDVRLNPGILGIGANLKYRVPSTFNYAGLINEKANNNDNFLRSNIDNEANKRKLTEPAIDMLPCRQDARGQVNTFARGETIQMPLRWNNPHDASCEVNIWTKNFTKVAPIKRPFHCGGGYQDQAFNVTIPKDFPECERESDVCVIQIYGHSVEPRTYAICLDFVLNPQPAPADVSDAQEPEKPAPGYDIPVTNFRQPIHYNDSFDTAQVDSQYSGYRGQQKEYALAHVLTSAEIQSFLGDGGLENTLGNARKAEVQAIQNKVKADIVNQEQLAIAKNQAAQAALPPGKCFEGELYGVINNPACTRIYQNTYVSNTNYNVVLSNFNAEFKKANLTAYSPKLKDAYTPNILATENLNPPPPPPIESSTTTSSASPTPTTTTKSEELAPVTSTSSQSPSPSPVEDYVEPASNRNRSPVEDYVAPAPSKSPSPSPVEDYVAPAPSKSPSPTPVEDYVAPAPSKSPSPTPAADNVAATPKKCRKY
jgi:hypothetical protein